MRKLAAIFLCFLIQAQALPPLSRPLFAAGIETPGGRENLADSSGAVEAWLPGLSAFSAQIGSLDGSLWTSLADALKAPPEIRDHALGSFVEALNASPEAGQWLKDMGRSRLLSPTELKTLADTVKVRTKGVHLRRDLAAAKRTFALEQAGRDARQLSSRLTAGSLELPRNQQTLKRFLRAADASVIAAHPKMLPLKMRKAVQSDFKFFRAFPNLFYLWLSNTAEAPKLLKTVRLFLVGDVHAENVEVVRAVWRKIKLFLAQFNDHDDAGYGPAAFDLARLLVGAALLGPNTVSSYRTLYKLARKAYLKSLDLSFNQWAAKVVKENAVVLAKFKNKRWLEKGMPLEDPALATKLPGMANTKSSRWLAFNIMGSGLSSIGLSRYLLASKDKSFVWDIKQLRPSALAYGTGKSRPNSNLSRVARGWTENRQIPVKMNTLRRDGLDWLVRARQNKEARLSLDDPESAARVLGGLLAQTHRRQVKDVSKLKAAIDFVPFSLVLSSIRYVSKMRRILVQLNKK